MESITNTNSKHHQRVQLYACEQPTRGIWEITGVVTAVWLRPNTEGVHWDAHDVNASLRNRVREVVKLNPWLAGWLELTPKDKTRALDEKVQRVLQSHPGDTARRVIKSTTSPAHLNWNSNVGDETVLETMVDRVFQKRIDWKGHEHDHHRSDLFALSETAATAEFDAASFGQTSSFLRETCPQTSMPNGFGLVYKGSLEKALTKAPSLGKVAWDRYGDKVLLVLSLAHPIADGTTYFQIFHMLLGETLPYALDATRAWNHDVYDGEDSFTAFRNRSMGKRNAVTLNSLSKTTKFGALNVVGRQLASLFRTTDDDPEQLFFAVNGEGVARVRKRLAAGGHGRRISSNDVLLRALTEIFGVDGRWNMWKDFRGDFFASLGDKVSDPAQAALVAAGNYIGLLNIFAKEYSGLDNSTSEAADDDDEPGVGVGSSKSNTKHLHSSSLSSTLIHKIKSPISSLVGSSSKNNAQDDDAKPRLRMQSILGADPDYSAMNQINPESKMANVTNWTNAQKIPRALPDDLRHTKHDEADSDLLPGGARVLRFLPVPDPPTKADPYNGGSFTIFHPDFATNARGVKDHTWIGARAQASVLRDFVASGQALHFCDGEHAEVAVPLADIFVL